MITKTKSLKGNVKRNATKLVKYAPNQIHQTTDYKIFKPLSANRGKKDSKGLDKNRVKRYVTLIKELAFIFIYGIVWVNKKMYIIDGHHKLEALRLSKKPVYFVVIDDDKVNPKANTKLEYIQKLMIVISNLNNTDSSWTALNHFYGALNAKFELAQLMYKYMSEVSLETQVPLNEIPPNHIYSLVKGDMKYFRSPKKIVVEDYLNDNDIHNAKSDRFLEDLDFYKNVIGQLKMKVDGTILNKIMNIVFHGYWMKDGYFFDKDRFLDAITLSDKIVCTDFKVDGLKQLISDIYNYKTVVGKWRKSVQIFKKVI